MSDAPGVAGKRLLVSQLRAVIEAKDEQIAVLASALEASPNRERRLELRVAELERRLGMDSSDSGTPGSKEPIGAKEKRKAQRRARQSSERERRKDRGRGGQPGHQGNGLRRDPEPDERKDAEPPAQCRRCSAGLDGAEPVKPRWAQVIDAEIIRKATEWVLPGLVCPCCGEVTLAEAPPGAYAGSVCYGPVLNAAAVLLACYGNVPAERTALLMGMLLGVPVSAGWVDKAAARVVQRLGGAGFDEAMLAALAGGDVLAADETPVNVLDPAAAPVPEKAGNTAGTGENEQQEQEADPGEARGAAAPGAPHVLIVRSPDGRLTWLAAIGSRRKAGVGGGIPAAFAGSLITDGYTGVPVYPRLRRRLDE